MNRFGNRPPPGQGPPPGYGMVTRMYKRDLRPIVVATASLTAFWTLASAVGAFRMFAFDVGSTFLHSLSPFALALGILYLLTGLISVFGVFAAYTQRLPLVKMYSLINVFAGLTVVAAAVVETVTHFLFKSQLINECTKDTTGDTVFYSWSWWGPTSQSTLNAAEAASFCNDSWSHDSWSEIVSTIIVIIFALLFVSLTLSYAHQLSDPTFSRSMAPPPPIHYAPPYAPPAQYGPPPGVPPPDYGYGAGGAARSADDIKHDDPFADFERIPDESKASHV